MPTFRCKIASKNGHVREKTLIAQNKDSLREHLQREGHFVIDIRAMEGLWTALKHGKPRRRISPKGFQVFNQEFAVLTKAGLPVIPALDTIIEKRADDDFTKILVEIRKNITGGASLSEAFGQYSDFFSDLYIASLKAGERSGDLSLALSRYVSYLKKINEIRRKIISASIYPLLLILVSVFAVLFLMAYVIPSFTETYFEAEAELPALTETLVGISSFFRDHLVFAILTLVALAAGYTYYKKTPSGSLFLDKMKMRIPFIGDIHRFYSISKLARTLATVLQGGIPLVEALRVSAGTLDNRHLKRKVEEAAGNIERGMGFTEALTLTGTFPILALSMLDAGEKSGSLIEILDDVADFYEGNVDAHLAVLTSSIEPALMVVMGLLVGFIVLAMYLPIFQMAGTIG